MDEYIEFIKEAKKLTGIDLGQYKRTQMERRLLSLRDKHGFKTYSEWISKLKTDMSMREDFLDRITINVSEFYRNSNSWDDLRGILKQKKPNQIKAWSSACSTGQEPYTLSILLSELNIEQYSILATDIDKKILKQAESGVYPAQEFSKIDTPSIKKCFAIEDGLWSVKESIKRHVQFKPIDLLSDPFQSNFDLILCRNVVIYFTEESKEKLYDRLIRSLNVGGHLFIGGSEQISVLRHPQIQLVKPFIYEKTRE